MSSIKNVTLWGASGVLSSQIAHSLVDAGFNLSVLSRSAERPVGIPEHVAIKQVADFQDSSALTAALRGQDAVVSVVGEKGIELQSHVIDAAVSAGVKFFIPSEYGCDTTQSKNVELPVFARKIALHAPLQRYADEGKIAYALLMTGPFLDWALDYGMLINLKGEQTQDVYNGGDTHFSTTTVKDIAKAVAGVLGQPDEFRNRAVRVNSAVVTQNQLIAAAKKAVDAPFETQSKPTAELVAASWDAFKKGEKTMPVMFGFLKTAIFDESHEAKFLQDDSKKLGLKSMNEAEVEELVAQVIKDQA